MIKTFKKLKHLEELIIPIMQVNARTREDDFILYGCVLKKLGIDLNMSLFTFLSGAKVILKAPPFESVTRCRRKRQNQMPELCPKKVQEARKEEEKEYQSYNRTKIKK